MNPAEQGSQPKKYYPKDLGSKFALKQTLKDVVDGNGLNDQQIEELCKNFFTNLIYVEIAGESLEGRDEALKIGAKVVVNYGEKIAKQLSKNDEMLRKGEGLRSEGEGLEVAPNKLNGSEDIKKISGGSMAKIIAKIAEIMAAMSPEEQAKFAGNVSALFPVLNLSFDKIPQSMQDLAKKPVEVVIIKNSLQGTEGGKIFDGFIEDHLSDTQKKEVQNISSQDLEEYKKCARAQKNDKTSARTA